MLQNARGTAFTISELLKENQQGITPPLHQPTQIRVNNTGSSILYGNDFLWGNFPVEWYVCNIYLFIVGVNKSAISKISK